MAYLYFCFLMDIPSALYGDEIFNNFSDILEGGGNVADPIEFKDNGITYTLIVGNNIMFGGGILLCVDATIDEDYMVDAP